MPVLEKLLHKLQNKIDPSQAPQVAPVPAKPMPKPKDPVDPPPETTYYLSARDAPAAQGTSSSSSALRPLSPSTLVFGFTRPGTSSPAVEFFLRCLPDPIGFMDSSAWYIHSQLSTSPSSSSHSAPGLSGHTPLENGLDALRISPKEVRWRHQYLHLILKDEPGLAYTADGRITVSLQWVSHVSAEVERGQRDLKGAEREFKGVLLHELVHTIQYDGDHSLPGWLVESIADYIRLHADLGPPHWRKPGQGRREKGWEDAYDAGARFLDWITGGDGTSSPPSPSLSAAQPTATSAPVAGEGDRAQGGDTTDPPEPTASQYPAHPPPPIPTPPANGQAPLPPKHRRPAVPHFVRDLNARLQTEKFQDVWWAEMAGADLELLWREYLDYYGVS